MLKSSDSRQLALQNSVGNISNVRNVIVVFGDQLNVDSTAFEGFDSERDAIVMMELREEATYIPQHKIRLVLFFSAMRHFRDQLRERGFRIFYRQVDDPENSGNFAGELRYWCQTLKPVRLIAVQPGDYRVLSVVLQTAKELSISVDIRPDRTFLCSTEEFREISGRQVKLILEAFYRFMRRRHRILMERGAPADGVWNFDAQNRKPLPRKLGLKIPDVQTFRTDSLTEQVKRTVEHHFPNAPGTLEAFDYPVTRLQALSALQDFIENRLAWFGPYQDAMSKDNDYLFHSRLSSCLNLHLLTAREVIEAAIHAYKQRRAPLPSVEGFIRQILGWREYVRGIYWQYMPEYAERNALGADLPVPRYLWTAETDMQCVRSAVQSIQKHAYTHHIQRLMVLGLHCLLLGVHPYQFHQWHMSLFVDAIDWVSLPNALGMSQFGDGGTAGTKPYCASGLYIHRMSNYCSSCRYDPARASGPDACPFTTLYWDFLARHADLLQRNRRTRYQLLNLQRRVKTELIQIRGQADKLKQNV